MRARGFTPGVPRVQMYTPLKSGGMGHEHAYTYAAAALCDQFDRALCGGKGEPARLAVEDAIVSACTRLGGGARQHPLAWWPAHLEDELRDDLLVEAYWKACLRLGGGACARQGAKGAAGCSARGAGGRARRSSDAWDRRCGRTGCGKGRRRTDARSRESSPRTGSTRGRR